ncbi:MAG: toprim domain-containing protein, partial [Deltaproteobacteria bacterium]|nr:toprim domain-containing protein [Deltaproteobacteria bacterium]
KTKGGFYDRLRSRLIFPIFDGRGTLLGFAGRVIGDGRPKYLNPPETLFYKKSDIFYGLYESLEVIRKKRQILIVEGYLDVIRMHENGWRETVAACGTALGNGHARYLKSLGLEKVYLLFDGDSAGVSAAEKSARLFIENELDSSIIILPDKLDPDDYFKQYKADDFSQLMNHAMSDFEFLIQLSAQAVKGKGIEYQKTVLNELLDTNNLIKNPIKKEIFTNKISDYFKIDKKTLSRKNTKSFGRSEASGRFNEPRPSFRGTEPFFFDQTSPEVRFLQYLITQVASITRSRQYVSPDDFNNPDLAKLYERFLHLSDEEFMGLSQDAFPELFVEFSSVILSLTQSSNKILTSTFSDEALDKLIYPIKMQKINQALKYGQSNPDKARELALKKQKLRQQFSHLNHRNDLKDTKKT